jgi:hypothetical protein
MPNVTYMDDRLLTQLLSDEELESELLRRRQRDVAHEQVPPWIFLTMVLALVVAWTFVFQDWFAPELPPQPYSQLRDNSLAAANPNSFSSTLNPPSTVPQRPADSLAAEFAGIPIKPSSLP